MGCRSPAEKWIQSRSTSFDVFGTIAKHRSRVQKSFETAYVGYGWRLGFNHMLGEYGRGPATSSSTSTSTHTHTPNQTDLSH